MGVRHELAAFSTGPTARFATWQCTCGIGGTTYAARPGADLLSQAMTNLRSHRRRRQAEPTQVRGRAQMPDRHQYAGAEVLSTDTVLWRCSCGETGAVAWRDEAARDVAIQGFLAHRQGEQDGGRDVSMARAERLRREAERLLEQAARIDARPAEPVATTSDENPVVTFSRTISSRVYTYAAIRAGRLWYVTGGSSTPSAKPWEELLDWIGDADLDTLRVASKWKALSQ